MKDSNRKTFWKGAAAGVFLTVLAMVLLSGVKDLRDTTGTLNLWTIKENIGMLQGLIEKYYLFEEDPETVENGIYKGMMSGLGDPYSVYYTPEEYAVLMETSEGQFCGIGCMVSQNLETGQTVILRVFDDSPAREAGILAGDILYTVSGEDVSGIDLDLLTSQYIRGEEGTTVDLTVYRDGQYIDMTVERRQVEVQTVSHQLMADQTGYVSVMEFDMVTTDQFKKAVEEMESQGMERLVIDLRNNPGGILDVAVDMAAYLLPEDRMNGLLVYTKDKNGQGDRFYCRDGQIQYENDYEDRTDGSYPKKDGHQLDLPIAVLINGDSASASELFSGALRDYDWAVLVGTTTFGKGIVQGVIPFADGSGIKMTNARYYTPSGFDLHGKGLEPDVEVELDPALLERQSVSLEEDNQFLEAVRVLKKEK